MKKILAIVLAAVMLLTLASGCGKTETNVTGASGTPTTAPASSSAPPVETPKEPVKMIMWGGVPEANGPQEVCDNFNKLDPNVQVEYYRYVNDDTGNTKLDMALAAGEKIDMFISYQPERRDRRAQTGNAADITELCKANDIDLIRDFGSAAAANMIDGKVYSIPTMKYMDLLVYNKDMFDAAGIPAPTSETTWADWREYAKQLTKGEGIDKTYGFMVPVNIGVSTAAYALTKYQPTTYWVKEDGSASLFKSIPEFATGVQFFKDMQNTDKTAMSYKDVVATKMDDMGVQFTAFANGKLAAFLSGTHSIRTIKDVKAYPHTFKTGFAPLPRADKDQKYYAPISTNDHISVNANCKTKEEAVKFLKWYFSKGYDPMIKNGRIPLYSKYDANAAAKLMLQGAETLIDEDSLKACLFGNYTDTKVPGITKAGPEINTIYQEELTAYLLDVTTIDQMLENVQKRADEALKNAK